MSGWIFALGICLIWLGRELQLRKDRRDDSELESFRVSDFRRSRPSGIGPGRKAIGEGVWDRVAPYRVYCHVCGNQLGEIADGWNPAKVTEWDRSLMESTIIQHHLRECPGERVYFAAGSSK